MTFTVKVCRHDKTTIITDHESGEIVCTACGAVVGNDMEVSFSTLATYNDGLTKNRYINTSSKSTLARSDNGLGTIIPRENVDAHGRVATATGITTRIRLLDAYTKHVERSHVINYYITLENVVSKFGMSESMKEKAAYIFRKACAAGLLHGVSGNSLMVASVYIVARENGIPVTIPELASVLGGHRKAKTKEISRVYRRIVFEMDIRVPIRDSVLFVPRIASRLGITEKVARSIMKNIALATAEGGAYLVGKNPVGIAAAVTWVTARLHRLSITQGNIAMAAGVSTVCMRNLVRGMRMHGIARKFTA